MRLNDDHRDFSAMVRALVDSEINPHMDEWERQGVLPAHELFPKLAAQGLLGLEYPAEYGGEEAGPIYSMLATEAYGRVHGAGVPMAIGVQTLMATPSLAEHGSEELKHRYLAPAIRGEMVAAVAVTEPDTGSDVSAVRTRAVRDGDDLVINGRKLYITNGAQADWLCLLARTSDEGGHRGMSQIVVPTDTPGFSVVRRLDKLGNRSSDTAELLFEDVRVPATNIIGAEGRGFQQQMKQFVVERMSASYGAVGQCEYALERTREYLRQRHTFGQPLASKQYIAFTLSELAARVELLRSLNLRTVEAIGAGDDITRLATIAKLEAGRLLRATADACMQFHGGVGYMEDMWTARFLRDARLASIGGGADEVMLQVLARQDGFPI